MFGIDMAPSGQEKSQFNQLNQSSGFATGLGEGDLTASSDFMRGLLSGDPTKVSQALAPQIKAIQDRSQQQKNTTAQFAPRSGGTAATTANIDTAAKGDLTTLTGELTGGAATSLASTGAGLLSAGMTGNEAGFSEAKTMQDQQAAKWGDIISSIASTVGTVAGIPGVLPGGGSTPFLPPNSSISNWQANNGPEPSAFSGDFLTGLGAA